MKSPFFPFPFEDQETPSGGERPAHRTPGWVLGQGRAWPLALSPLLRVGVRGPGHTPQRSLRPGGPALRPVGCARLTGPPALMSWTVVPLLLIQEARAQRVSHVIRRRQTLRNAGRLLGAETP